MLQILQAQTDSLDERKMILLVILLCFNVINCNEFDQSDDKLIYTQIVSDEYEYSIEQSISSKRINNDFK